MKTKHYIIIAVLIILLVAYFLFRAQIAAWLKGKPTKQAIVTAPVKTELDYNKVLKNGVYNSPEVKQLQEWLGGLALDGDFGPETENALRARIHFSQTTLAEFQRLVSQESDSDLTGVEQSNDNSLFQPFSGFSLDYLAS